MNKEKYLIDNNYIHFENGFVLKYYMSNNGEQVVIPIEKLGSLPIVDQLYWKSFNEEPKSNLSLKMVKNIFKGEWFELDSLDNFKNLLRNFPKCYIKCKEYEFWIEPNSSKPHTLDDLNYVKINSKEYWESEIITLYLNLIEGLQINTIKLISKKLSCYNKELKSIKQFKECLYKQNIVPNKEIDQIISPLQRLDFYRSKVISHNTSNEYPTGNLNDNFEELLNDCYISIKFISNMIELGLFNFN